MWKLSIRIRGENKGQKREIRKHHRTRLYSLCTESVFKKKSEGLLSRVTLINEGFLISRV
jgi:hypothetical protein